MNRRLSIVLAVVLVLAVTAIAIGGCGVKKESNQSKSSTPATTPASTSPSSSPQSAVLGPDGKPVKTLADFPDGQDGANVQAVIKTDKGDIVLGFFPDVAPVTTASFIHLARTGFYNGTTFHRVVPNFVIQGGDPKSKDPNAQDVGTGGPGYYLPLETSNKPHVTGSLAMARSNDPNSGGSQFYICLADQPSLNGQYTVFGQVITGMDVVNKITQGDVIRSITIVPKTQ
jgi:peptidyl-prolyl cis-trans isomerase B (cyclophilin B)